MPCLGPMYGWCKKIFAAMSNLTFSNTKAYFSTFPQKKERRCGGGLSISESNSERSSPSHFGLVWEILFVKERSHRIPNRPRPLWIGPFGNLEKIAHKLEGIRPEGRSVSSVCSQSLLCRFFTGGRFCRCRWRWRSLRAAVLASPRGIVNLLLQSTLPFHLIPL